MTGAGHAASYVNVKYINMRIVEEVHMEIAAKLDDYGLAAWIAVMVLAFIIFWPIGLAILAYLIWSGRMGCWKQRALRGWRYEGAGSDRAKARCQRRRDRQSSGNRAFDEYREETLRRLEDEQKEFWDFLDRLRHAKDKEEFDQFMADRRRRASEQPGPPEGPPEPQPQPQA